MVLFENNHEHVWVFFPFLSPFPFPCSQAAFVLGGLLLNLCVITQPRVCNAWFMLPFPPFSPLPLLVHHWPFITALSQFKKCCRLTDIAVFASIPSAEKWHPVNRRVLMTWYKPHSCGAQKQWLTCAYPLCKTLHEMMKMSGEKGHVYQFHIGGFINEKEISNLLNYSL